MGLQGFRASAPFLGLSDLQVATWQLGLGFKDIELGFRALGSGLRRFFEFWSLKS